jgi:hypothetical protein
MLRLNILPEGYIYPKEDQPLRDLFLKSGHLVQIRTALINSLQGIISVIADVVSIVTKSRRLKRIISLHYGSDLPLNGAVSKDCIDFMTGRIRDIERTIKQKTKLRQSFAGV